MLIEQRRLPQDQVAQMQGGKLDADLFLPLSTIRQHTKTDDVPSVTDDMLRLYRKAALEAAEKYTGLLLRERKVQTDAVTLPKGSAAWFSHRARFPFAQPVAWFYGLSNAAPVQVHVVPGERRARLPAVSKGFGMGCCNPCGEVSQARLLYVAGFACEGDVPAAIALGALKYIAHVIENPGDIAYANTPSGNAGDSAAIDKTANPAWASGAIEIWRSCKDDAI